MAHCLAPDDEVIAQRIIVTGRYSDVAQVVSVALRQLDERERGLDNLRAAIAEGLASIERGEVIEWTPELTDEIWREAVEAHERREHPKADVCPS